jgi:hypothetical protein
MRNVEPIIPAIVPVVEMLIVFRANEDEPIRPVAVVTGPWIADRATMACCTRKDLAKRDQALHNPER